MAEVIEREAGLWDSRYTGMLVSSSPSSLRSEVNCTLTYLQVAAKMTRSAGGDLS